MAYSAQRSWTSSSMHRLSVRQFLTPCDRWRKLAVICRHVPPVQFISPRLYEFTGKAIALSPVALAAAAAALTVNVLR